MRKLRGALILVAALGLVGVACGGGSSGEGGGGGGDGEQPQLKAYDANAQGEGQLSLIAWPGYTQPKIVKPFEEETGCQVTLKYGNTSDEMVNLMRQQGGSLYDGVSASGDATNRLIASGDVAAIDVNSFPGYGNVMTGLQAPAHNTVDGVHYGVPYTWGPNILMYNTDIVKPAPTSWDIVFEADSPYAGKITAYDSPIYIADAAMYLKSHQPDLGITDPYELTQDQFNAAVGLLKQQAGMISKYWALYTDEIDGFESQDMAVGTAWPVNLNLVQADGKVPVDGLFSPEEGVTGWADTWMMSSKAAHETCMLKWMEYSLRPEVQTVTAEYFGATPSVTDACPQLETDLGKDAALYHCGDDDYLSGIFLWKTPLPDCGDDRGQACVDYSQWTSAWTEIRGAG
ncbi:MAG TPA: extracellular solute-binding protein [Actinomycetota bacterium]|jgi:putative spermidine/putrescine transport system substrate-binding protein|nr:extracellular solute-binding protein [Actinomycetota bacterium]